MPAVEDFGINPGHVATDKSVFSSTTEFVLPLPTSESNSANMETMSNSNGDDEGFNYEAVVAVAIGTSAALVVVTNVFRGLGYYFERNNQRSYAKWCNRIAAVSSLGSTLLMKAKPVVTNGHANCTKPCKLKNLFFYFLFPEI